ncbi:ATP-binding protein [Chryseobacterium sp. ISL-6]|uniref:sensor histidine kinase n=1 Tax=Chryseobacterium sp. ISL-6 TaxID=2819143 RepID=UPI001BEC54D2|nr:ATP-binding protein [Chryseobacterium sp. ISL-6]MBT2620129.1 ATP-binding protein [Chryseobacterium sp. ISL-6]
MSQWENPGLVVGWIWIGIGLFFLTTLLITILIVNYLKSIRKNKQKVMRLVRNTQTECWENTLHLQERDRERLAEELHDNIISRLNVIRLNINNKNTEELNLDLKTSMQLIRELSHNLTPPDLSEIELTDLIADYLDQISKNIEIAYHHMVSEAALSSPVKLNIFRIVQELITNVLKHANATRIDVSLRVSPDYLTLTIEDNGNGFKPETHYNGIGLRNIQSRAQKIQAVYKLKSRPEKGTKFIAAMALE